MITSDTSVFATSFSADICAGSWPCSTHDRNSSDKRSRSAPRRISVSAVGADADPHDRQLGVLAAPRVQDLVERGLARAVGRDTGTRTADVVARRDQHHAVLGQMGKCGAQHVVGADGVDGEGVHPRRDIGVLDVGEGNRGAGEDHRVKTAERLGGLADDLADRRRVLHVQFEGGAADGCRPAWTAGPSSAPLPRLWRPRPRRSPRRRGRCPTRRRPRGAAGLRRTSVERPCSLPFPLGC